MKNDLMDITISVSDDRFTVFYAIKPDQNSSQYHEVYDIKYKKNGKDTNGLLEVSWMLSEVHEPADIRKFTFEEQLLLANVKIENARKIWGYLCEHGEEVERMELGPEDLCQEIERPW